jgi:hypothetical protein
MTARSPYVTIDSVRWFLAAAAGSVSSITGEPDFTDQDIVRAIEMTARRYNSTPPIGMNVNSGQLCDEQAFWYDLIGAMLYRVLVRRLQEEDLELDIGEGGVDPVKKRIDFLTEEATRMEREGGVALAEYKHAKNLSDYFKGGIAIG